MKGLVVKKENKAEVKKCLENDTKVTIVLFYAAWCPHCQHMKPAWEETKEKLKPKRNVQVVEAEYEDIPHVPAKYKKGVNSFPTIRKIKGGKVIDEYYGDRSTEDLLRFAKEQKA